MHQSRPYGLHAIGLPLTDKDEAFISNVAARIANLKELSGIDSMKMVYDLPDGGYVIVQDAGGNFRVISHKPVYENTDIGSGLATTSIPMLYSGVVTKSMLYYGEGLGFRLSDTTRRRVVDYDASAIQPSKDVELQRFRIPYNSRFSEFLPKTEGNVLVTQYRQLRPTWYSGAMAEVMQIVGGYGKTSIADPSIEYDPLNKSDMILPAEVADAIASEVKAVRLSGYLGVPPADGKFQYDYKFNRTNAVGFDDKQNPWLLRINSSGVWAMPLPIVPASATKSFMKYIEDVGDDEILDILLRFGALPSGEPFPESSDLQAWRRAGVVIKICDTSDFYSHSAYSTACGWSLNTNGSEGYNTCYDYDDDGLGVGFTYKLRLDLKSSIHHVGVDQVDIEVSDEQGRTVQKYLSNLLPSINGKDHNSRAVLYKLRRVPVVDIYKRALEFDGSNDYEYWNALELNPIADHKGNVTKVYQGYLYHNETFRYQPQIKFPEPLMNGCVSHDFLPVNNGQFKAEKPNCDTIMFAYYIGNSLKTVKYFIDWALFSSRSFTNFEKEMYAGAWYKESYSGLSSIMGCFYLSDIDDREVVSPSKTRTDLIGTDRGWDTKPRFEFDWYGSMPGTMFRYRYYSHKQTTVREEGRVLEIAVCIPFLSRNSALHAKRDKTSRVIESESQELLSQRDPNEYRYWTYHPVFAYGGMMIKNPKGRPYPSNGDPVWVEEHKYSYYNNQNYADNGPWLPALPLDYTWLIHPNSNEWRHSGGGNVPYVERYSKTKRPTTKLSGSLSISLRGQPDSLLQRIPEEWYFISSPDPLDPTGNIFYRDIASIVFGASNYSSCSEVSLSGKRFNWGYSKLVDNSSAHHFTGVINE